MAPALDPHCKKLGGLLNLSYELPRRLRAAATYPIAAPNGSSILIYASSTGLTFLWRGGRGSPDRIAREHSSTQRPGESDENVMVLDSDDANARMNGGPHNDAENPSPPTDFDPSRPYEPIHETHHVDLDSPPLHLAVPPLHHAAISRFSAFIPSLFSQSIVVAAACADGTVRILAVPFAFPTSGVRDTGSEDILVISPKDVVPSAADGIALSWTSNKTTTSRKNTDEQDCELVVATHSSSGPALLSVYKVQLKVQGHSTLLAGCDQSWTRVRLLSSPASSIAFNSCNYQSSRHTQLLVVESTGAVRIFDPTPVLLDQESPRSAQMSNPKKWGSWLLSLFPGYEDTGSFSGALRKRIIDAQWACNGKCIIVLLGDGEWGLWDIEGVGPQSTPSKGKDHAGGSATRFSLHGFMGDAPAPNTKLQSGKQLASTRPEKLAPMTPNTRKAKQSSLFSTKTRSEKVTLATGAISVMPTSGLDDKLPEESLVFKYNDNLFIIPQLMSYWQRAITSTAEFSQRLSKIPFSSEGEVATSISQINRYSKSPGEEQSSRIYSDILLAAEHRFVIVAPELQPPALPRRHHKALSQLDSALDIHTNGSYSAVDAQALLAGGDLDLGGINQMLDGFESAQAPFNEPIAL